MLTHVYRLHPSRLLCLYAHAPLNHILYDAGIRFPMCLCSYLRTLHSITYSILLELIRFLFSRGRGIGLAGFPVQSGSSLCIWAMLFCVNESLRLWPGLRLCASLGILDTLKMTDSAVQNHVSLQGLLSREPVHFFYASRNLSQAILFFSLCFDLKFPSFLPRFLA